MSKDPIKVYWTPYVDPSDTDWSFLYNKPVTVYSDLLLDRNKDAQASLFACPAFSTKFNKMLTFKCPSSFSYIYDYSKENKIIAPITDNYINIYETRNNVMNIGPNFKVALGFLFFSEESLTASLTPPYFHKPQYTQTCSVIPGQFDIGNWFRPISFEIQTWAEAGTIDFKEDEPLAYIEFNTDRDIELQRFNMTEKIFKYSLSVMNSFDVHGRRKTLKYKYKKFKEVGLREKILTEIKNNLLEEEPFIF